MLNFANIFVENYLAWSFIDREWIIVLVGIQMTFGITTAENDASFRGY